MFLQHASSCAPFKILDGFLCLAGINKSMTLVIGWAGSRWAELMQIPLFCHIHRMSEEKKPKKRWTKKQLRASQGLLTMQAKTNIYASQAGMTGYGAVRHGADIRADDQVKEGESMLTQQAETNIYDSQKGTRGFGAVRHGPDIRVRELYEEGDDDEYPED